MERLTLKTSAVDGAQHPYTGLLRLVFNAASNLEYIDLDGVAVSIKQAM